MTGEISLLSFDDVDDIGFALSNGAAAEVEWPEFNARSIGPLLELYHARPELLKQKPPWIREGGLAPIADARRAGVTQYVDAEASIGIFSAMDFDDELRVTDFIVRARRAAKDVGFSTHAAAKLLGAIEELRSNILEHSQLASSGYIAFKSSRDDFEFVVADAGIGTLQSLKQNPAFAALEDDGRALELVLREGISRHTNQPDRGMGFRPLFVGLANMSQSVRFRSGDHARELQRLGNGSIPAQTSQKPRLPGFFTYVQCSPKN